MKKILFSSLILIFAISIQSYEKSDGKGFVVWDGEKDDQIKFYLDLKINSNNPDSAINLIEEMVAFIKDLEPNTIAYEYFISNDKKSISLSEKFIRILMRL
jgi:hypothetical protein